MMNQIKLTLKTVKWILTAAGMAILINIIRIFVDSVILSWVSGTLTLLTTAAVYSIVISYHNKFKDNGSYRLYFTMPVKKETLIKTDYINQMLMIIIIALIYTTWVWGGNEIYLMFALPVMIGAVLIINSVYLYRYPLDWFKSVGTYATNSWYMIPIGLFIAFYFIPMKDDFHMYLEMSSFWYFYFIVFPFMLLVIGIIANTVSYVKAKQLVLKTDID